MDPEKLLEDKDIKQEISSENFIADPSTSSSCIPPSETETKKKEDAAVMAELQRLRTIQLLSPPSQATILCTPSRNFQYPIPSMNPTPSPAHCNGAIFGRNMNPMYSPFNFPYSNNPNSYGELPAHYARGNDLRVPHYAHTNNLPRARLVHRIVRHNPVHQPLLGRNNPTTNIPQDFTEKKKNNATRHLCTNCNKTYASPSSLSSHQLYRCPASNCFKKSFTCKQCGEVCKSFAIYKLHCNTHTGLQ